MNKTFAGLTFFLFISAISLSAQEDSTALSGSEAIINKGIELHDKGDYQGAVNEYKQVSECDPNYSLACYEMALSYYYKGDKEKALKKCHEAEFLHRSDPELFSLIGSILDDMGHSKKSISVLQNALKKWPYNEDLLYNLAICYLKINQPEKAEPLLINSIYYDPFHAASHMALAKANYMMGRLGQSYLAYNMAILLNPSISYIRNFEKAVTGKIDSLSQPYKYSYPEGMAHQKWDRLRWFMQSHIAFSNKFDYDYKVNYLVCRESLLLFREMKYDPSDTSLYNQFYVRFFTDMMNKGYFEAYLNYQFKNVSNKDVATWIDKNSKKYNAFVNWAQDLLNERRSYRFSFQNEQNKITVYHYDEDGDLSGIGKQSADDKKIKSGAWILIDPEGSVVQRGSYVNDTLAGKWDIYYPDGKIKQKLLYHNGLLNDTVLSYYPNGQLKASYPKNEGKNIGTEKHYSSSGDLIAEYIYKDDKLNGPASYTDYDKCFNRSYFYVNDSIQGKFVETWLNGVHKKKCTYKNGQLNGNYETWYKNSKPEFERTYVNGVKTGKSIDYFPTGTKSSEAEFDTAGKMIHKYISYYRNGQISSKEFPYTNGMLNGKLIDYYRSGKKEDEIIYKDNLPVKMACFNTRGDTIYQARAKDSSMYFKSYFPNGILNMEGLLYKGNRHGNWKIYNPHGKLLDNLNYVNGLQWGPQQTYYPNDTLHEEYSCDSDYVFGPYTEYYKTGDIKSKGSYDKDGQTGEWYSYYPNDSLRIRQFFENGYPVGRSIDYSETGKIVDEIFYDNDGNSIRSIDYDESQHVLCDTSYKYGSVEIKEYFANGKVRQIKHISDNTLNGLQEAFYPNGQLKYKINYIHGKIDGVVRKWDDKGNITLKMPYALGKPEGKATWFKDGKPDFTGNYVNGLAQDTLIDYNYQGKIYRILQYNNDKRQGNSDYYAPDGSLMGRLRFYENTLVAYSYKKSDGTFTPEIAIDTNTTEVVCYYPNGRTSIRMAMKKGLYNGKMICYYPNGKIMTEANFKDGDDEGPYLWYYPNGQLMEKTNYHRDKKDGEYISYYDNGQKKKEGHYTSGNEEGEWYIYDKTGKLTETQYFFNGEMYAIGKK